MNLAKSTGLDPYATRFGFTAEDWQRILEISDSNGDTMLDKLCRFAVVGKATMDAIKPLVDYVRWHDTQFAWVHDSCKLDCTYKSSENPVSLGMLRQIKAAYDAALM